MTSVCYRQGSLRPDVLIDLSISLPRVMGRIFREEDSIATGALVVDSEIVARRMGVGMEVQMIIAAIFLEEVCSSRN